MQFSCADIPKDGTMMASVPVGNSSNHTINYTVQFHHFWLCSVEFYIQAQLKMFAPPIMIVLGSIGNVLSFVVLTRRTLIQYSICYYLAIYAVTNTLVLFIGCGLDWFSHVTETPYIANVADWLCRVWQFIYNVIIYAAGWIVVSMVIDRFIVVWHPRHAPYMCTVFMSKLVTIIILIGLVVISIHAMWTYELTTQGCYIDPMQEDFQTIAWPWISATLYSYIPLILIFIFQISLLIGLVYPRSESVSLTNMNQNVQDQLTKLTIVVSLLYLILNLPTIIVNFIEYAYNSSTHAIDYGQVARLLLARVACQTISCLNSAVSFILYFAMVPQMRKELMTIINKLKGSDSSSIEEMQTMEVNSNGDMYVTKLEQDATSATQV